MKRLIMKGGIPALDIHRAVAFYNAILHIELAVLDFGKEKMACFPNDEGAIFIAAGYPPIEQGIVVNFKVP